MRELPVPPAAIYTPIMALYPVGIPCLPFRCWVGEREVRCDMRLMRDIVGSVGVQYD